MFVETHTDYRPNISCKLSDMIDIYSHTMTTQTNSYGFRNLFVLSSCVNIYQIFHIDKQDLLIITLAALFSIMTERLY